MSDEPAQRQLILFTSMSLLPEPLRLEPVSTTTYTDGPVAHTYAS